MSKVKLPYNNPLDITLLFMEEQIDETFTYIISSFINEVEEREGQGEMFIYPAIGHELTRKINIEYAFFIKKLSELVNNPLALLDDYSSSPKNNDTKYNIFLIHSLLENTLGLVAMNRNKIYASHKGYVTFSPSFFVPMIVQRDNYFAQLAAVTFARNAFNDYVSDELLNRFNELVFDGMCVQVDNVYGVKQCIDFWKEKKEKIRYVALV